MKILINKSKVLNYILLLYGAILFTSCKKDFGNLNSPTEEQLLKNPTKDQLDNIVSGTESAMRINMGLYLDDVGVIGREMYRFSTGDPRYTTDLLGASDAFLSDNGFYLTNTWSSRYRIVRNCNLLISSTQGASFLTDAQKKGYTGFAKTIMAYQLLLNLNLTYNNGIRVDVTNADRPGNYENLQEALTSIFEILQEGSNDLAAGEVIFSLSSGFSAFNDADGLNRFNRALAARVALYRSQWQDALDALSASFFNINGNFSTGAYHVFGTGSGDQLNPAFFPRNSAGDVRLAHPSYAAEIEPNDSRINKALTRNESASYQGLASDRDVWVYTSSTAPIPIIRNEELVLIFAEANIQLNNLGDAEDALNIIRNAHNLADYSGASTQEALIDEMLKQRRYSLFYEGHRWIDMRRYDRLHELPVDRPEDNVWTEFPVPVTEQQ